MKDSDLITAAIAILKKDEHAFPYDWEHERIVHILKKSYEERLAIAGALIAAKLDCLHYIDSTKQG